MIKEERRKHGGPWVVGSRVGLGLPCISTDVISFPTTESSRNKRMSLLSNMVLDAHWCLMGMGAGLRYGCQARLAVL